MAHTPGPWIAREPEEDELYEVYAENGGDLICYPVCNRNQRDNIRLIAAAPELLVAVRKTVAELEILDEDSDVAGWRNLDATYVDATIAGLLRHLEQCIAKAEGVTMEDEHESQN